MIVSDPQPGIELTYVKLSGESNGDGGDQYTGLDRFGRVVDQRWIVTSTGTALDRFQYGYDQDGTVLHKYNPVNSAANLRPGIGSCEQVTSDIVIPPSGEPCRQRVPAPPVPPSLWHALDPRNATPIRTSTNEKSSACHAWHALMARTHAVAVLDFVAIGGVSVLHRNAPHKTGYIISCRSPT